MHDAKRSRRDLLAEVRGLRARVAALERERTAADPAEVTRLLDQIPAVVWTVDRDLRLSWCRGGGLPALGLDAEALIGVDLFAFLGSTDPEHPAIHAHREAVAGRARDYETVHDERCFRAHVEPLRDERGRIAGAVGVALDITERVRAEADREALIEELREAHGRVKTLSGLVPICMHCKNVRDDRGYWQRVDTWVRRHSDAEFSHGICPECMERLRASGPAARRRTD